MAGHGRHFYEDTSACIDHLVFTPRSRQCRGGGDVLEKHLYAGTLSDGAAALSGLPEGDGLAEKKAAQGLIAFVSAVEHLGQSLHRHGLETHPGGVMMQLPVLRMPVEPNPNPEPVTYEKWRAILQTLADDLGKADTLLAEGAKADVGGSVKLPLDLMKVRADLNSDGAAAETESLGAILQALSRMSEPTYAAGSEFYFRQGGPVVAARLYPVFDRIQRNSGWRWILRRASTRRRMPIFRAPVCRWQRNSSLLLAPVDLSTIRLAMQLLLVHLLNWQVIDPNRLKEVRTRLATMASLSRESWAAARAETDDDKEWLPNAKQKGRWGMDVDDATIDSWLAVMGEFETVLDGKKLMPHWRFNKGFNVKRFFDESKHIDAVLIIAGVDAVPFLESGPISTTADWDGLTGAFRGNFLNYAIWFN